VTRQLLFALLFAALAACGSKPAPETTPEAGAAEQTSVAAEAAAPTAEPQADVWRPTPTARPANVLAIAVVPSVERFARDAVAYAQAAKLPVPVTPDTVGQLITSALEAQGLRGLRLDAPAYVVVVDVAAELPLAVVLPTSDPEVLEEDARKASNFDLDVRVAGDYAVVAEAAVADAVADYALTRLLDEPLPKHPTATAFGDSLRAKFAPQLAMARAFIGGMKESSKQEEAMGAALIEMYLDLAEQLEVAAASIEVTGDLASIVFDTTGAPDTTMATFTAAQKPADFSELAYLPEQTGMFVAAGRLEWAPLADVFLEFARLAVQTDAGSAVDWQRLFALFDDELAMSMTWGERASMMSSIRTSEPKELEKGMISWWEDTAASPLYDQKTARLRTRKVRGKVTTEFEFSYAPGSIAAGGNAMQAMFGKPPYRNALVALNGRLGMALFGDARKSIERYITGNRRPPKAAPDPVWVELAKSRGESFAMTMDFSSMVNGMNNFVAASSGTPAAASQDKLPPGIEIPQGLGFRDRTMRYRMSVPAAVAERIGRAAMNAN